MRKIGFLPKKGSQKLLGQGRILCKNKCCSPPAKTRDLLLRLARW